MQNEEVHDFAVVLLFEHCVCFCSALCGGVVPRARGVIRTSWLCARPCLRKMQAGPTMLCNMLQFLTRVHKGSSNARPLPPSSSSSSSSVSTSPVPPRGPSMAEATGTPLRSVGDASLDKNNQLRHKNLFLKIGLMTIIEFRFAPRKNYFSKIYQNV